MKLTIAVILLLVSLGSVQKVTGQDLWGEWGPFSACDPTCGTGSRQRRRDCLSTSGAVCVGASIEFKICDNVPCQWGLWGPYSDCTVTCGGGTMTRTRTCLGGSLDDCEGTYIEPATCSTDECPASTVVPPVSRYSDTLCESDADYNGICQRNDYECTGGLYTDGLCRLNATGTTTASPHPPSPVTKGWIYHSCCIQGSTDGYSARIPKL